MKEIPMLNTKQIQAIMHDQDINNAQKAQKIRRYLFDMASYSDGPREKVPAVEQIYPAVCEWVEVNG